MSDSSTETTENIFDEVSIWNANHTFRTILLSEVGVRPTQSANLHGSPSTCSVTPSSEV